MPSPELVEDIGCIETSIITQLPGDDLQGLCIGSNEQLLLAWDGSGIIPQVLGQFHLYSTSSSHNGVILQRGNKKIGLRKQRQVCERSRRSYPEGRYVQQHINLRPFPTQYKSYKLKMFYVY